MKKGLDDPNQRPAKPLGPITVRGRARLIGRSKPLRSPQKFHVAHANAATSFSFSFAE
jgi:hypothetical protein